MSTWVWIVILAIVWSAMRAKRTRALQDTFGGEYDRTVDQSGDHRAAERELRDRQKQHEQDVMQERGYPTKDFERRVADISIDHPGVVEKYRTADGIARASERGEASTEDMRHSVRHYRALFA